MNGSGKFEQLEVTSHEIAASTAQLVAASRVKADMESRNFTKVCRISPVSDAAVLLLKRDWKSEKWGPL